MGEGLPRECEEQAVEFQFIPLFGKQEVREQTSEDLQVSQVVEQSLLPGKNGEEEGFAVLDAQILCVLSRQEDVENDKRDLG